MSAPELEVSAHTRRWIEQFVVGQSLCPFAAPVLRDGQLRVAVCEATAEPEWAMAALNELDLLQRTPAEQLATSVLIFTRGLDDFEHYLDFLAFVEELLEESGLEGIVQVASFHPAYRFDGVAADDVSNYTNRSPYPMLHFIREDDLARALVNYADPEQIPQRNIEHLRSLGSEAVLALLDRIRVAPPR